MKYLIILTVFLAGCDLSVTPATWETAISACSTHGGLKTYYADGDLIFGAGISKIRCNDNTLIVDLPDDKKEKQ